MLLAHMDVVHTFKGSGFTMTGTHISSFQNVSIQWQELFAIVAAALTWGHTWRQKCIRFYCDNLVIVNSWEGKSSKHPRIMSLLHTLILTAAKDNFIVSLKYLPGKVNEIVDALSRKQFICFFHFAPQAQ